MAEELTKLIIALEDLMVTPICKEDVAYNDGIRTAIMVIETVRGENLD